MARCNDLLVDEVGGGTVLGGVVPGRKDLFAEEEPPRGVAFLRSLLLGVLFALRYCIHYVIPTASQ